VPAPLNPQALNRYSYVYNRPHLYIDDDGHLPLIVTALIGAAVGFTVNVGWQVVPRIGKGLTVEQVFAQVHWGQAAGSAAGGFVMGLTLGLGTAAVGGATLSSSTVFGAWGAIFGGQAAALTEAGYDEAVAMLNGAGFEGTRFLDTATACGFLDPATVLVDAASGGFAAGVGYGLSAVASTRLNIPRSLPPDELVPRIVAFMPNQGMVMIEYTGARVLMIPMSSFEQMMQYTTEFGYENARSFLEELIQTGVAIWANEPLEQ